MTKKNGIRWLVLIIVLFVLLLAPTGASAQGTEASYVAHTIIYADLDRDGDDEAVGEDIAVEVRQGGRLIATALTDEFGDAGFVLQEGFYRFSAWVPNSRFFYQWICERIEGINRPNQYILITCFERSIIQMPWLLGG